ncbi:MAG: hypothetical protein HRU13_06770 [Phycisphaerales bacterium]|nr:hypothetical protein [Phycisphaerales bacterium]
MRIALAILLLIAHVSLPFVIPLNAYSRHYGTLFELQSGLEELERSGVLHAGESPHEGAPWSFWAAGDLRDSMIEVRTSIDPFQVALMFVVWLWGVVSSLALLWSGLRTTRRTQ